MLEQYDDILLVEDVCEILKICPTECYKMLKCGKELSGYRVGKTWRIPKANVLHYIRSKTINNKA